ncbi:MAG: NAD(P)-dependent alcohol dehydrogenase [Actinomycetota bacterium]
MKAAVVEQKGGPFELRELELGPLRADEVLVRVVAAGICHTDLICRDQWLPVPLPAVLGHEGAGVVEAVGEAVTEFAPGDRVGMSYDFCGACPACERGLPVYCHAFFEHNFAAARPEDTSSVLGDVHAHFFGQSSFATHAVARERNLVLLPDDVPFEIAAPFGCGIQTGAGAVLNALRPQAGSSFAVFGAGAVGLAAVMAARAVGCTKIVAVDLRPRRLELARELGATQIVDASTEDPVDVVGATMDFSLEVTGSPAAIRQAIDVLAPLGTCGIVGAPAVGTEASFDVTFVMTAGRTIRGIVEGESRPKEFLAQLFELWRRGALPVERMISYYDFDDIDRAVRDAESGDAIKPVLRIG